MNYKKPTLWIIIAAIVICAVVAVCFLTNPNTSDNETLNNATEGMTGSSENTIEQLLDSAIIIKDNNTGKILYDGTQNEPLPPTYLYMVDKVTEDIIDSVNSPMTAEQLTSFFVNGGKEMLDGPVNQNIYLAKNDVKQKATIHSIVVKTAAVTFRYTYDAEQEPGEFEDVKVVLTDGTVIDALGSYGVSGDNGEFISTYAMSTIIPVEDIDYVQVGETIVAIPHPIIPHGNPMIPAP